MPLKDFWTKNLNIFLFPFLEKPRLESGSNTDQQLREAWTEPASAWEGTTLHSGWSRAWSQAVAQLHLAQHTFPVALEEMGTICYPATWTAKPLLPQLQAALHPSAPAAHPSSRGQATAPSGDSIVTNTAGGPEEQGCMHCNSRRLANAFQGKNLVNSRELKKVRFQASSDSKQKCSSEDIL